RHERQVFTAVQRAVREALAAHAPVPSFGTRGAEGWQVGPALAPQPGGYTGPPLPAGEPTGPTPRPAFAEGEEEPPPHLQGAQNALDFDYAAPNWDAFAGDGLAGAQPAPPTPNQTPLFADESAAIRNPQSAVRNPELPPL